MSSSKQCNPLVCRLTVAVAVAALLCAFAPLVVAQGDAISIHVTPAKRSTYSYSNIRYHILPANTVAGQAALAGRRFGSALPPSRLRVAPTTVPAPGFYPDDLVNFGGPVVTNLQSHAVYLNTSYCGTVATCWGNPEKFLSDLGLSTFIHITDQYTGTAGTYSNGTHVNAAFTMYTNMIDESDLFAVVHDSAVKLGTPSGYGHEYHVFLPPGIDTCFDETSICYSPDNPSAFYFCAYHGSLDFSDIGHVLFSVEPSQDVPGCQAAPPNPNSELIDSTNSVLSHELIETITDPDIDAWIANNSLIAAGAEIGDLCEPVGNSSGQFLDSTLVLHGHKYELQLEYSNLYHACSPK